MALQITITDAGRAEIINAQNTGTDPVTIAEIGLGTGQYVPAESQTALVAEFKRLTTFGGSVVAADVISIAIRDDSSDVYSVSEFGLYTASGTLLAVYSVVGTPFFDKAAASILLLAVDIKLTTLDAAALTFGDINFVNPPATETVMGVAELATAAEVQAGTDAQRIVTPAGLSSRTATETRTGLVELATNAEGQTGTDTARAVTPAVMRADSATANTANRVVRRGASGEISVGAITSSGNISGVNGTFTGPVSVQNFSYSGSLTGGTGVINIGSGQFYKDAAGNIGLGVTPSASSVVTFEGPSSFIIANTGDNGMNVLANTFFDGSFRYKSSASASRYNQAGGNHQFFTAPAGTAGNPITFTQAMTLTQGGNLLVGTSTDGGQRAQVTGSSLGGSRAILRLDGNDGVGGGGRTTYLSFAGTSNDTGPVQTEFAYIGGAKQNGMEGNTQGYLVGAVNNGSGLVEVFKATPSSSFLINTATDDGIHKLQVNGLASASTPAQFDNDTSLATSAFVQRALGNYSDVRIIAANTVLTAADAGKYIFINASSISVTLPDPATLPPGATFTIVQSVTTFGAQIVAPGGVTMNGVMTGSTTSPIVMQNKAEYEIVAVTGSAYQVAMFGGTASLVASGYQFLPSGLIMQWGTSPIGSFVTVTFPIAFPNAVFSVVGTATTITDADLETLSYDQYTTTGFRATGDAGRWIAIGH